MTAAAVLTPTMANRQMASRQMTLYGDGRAFSAAFERLRGFIAERAKKLAFGDADLADDLAQQAAVHLWELDPSRYGEEDQLYLRSALVRKMIDTARAEQVHTARRLELAQLKSRLQPTTGPEV